MALSKLQAIVPEPNAAGRALTGQARDVVQRTELCGQQAERANDAARDGGSAIELLVADMRTIAQRLVVTVGCLNTLAHSTGTAIRAQLAVVVDVSASP